MKKCSTLTKLESVFSHGIVLIIALLLTFSLFAQQKSSQQ
jgi:hypothetical protein